MVGVPNIGFASKEGPGWGGHSIPHDFELERGVIVDDVVHYLAKILKSWLLLKRCPDTAPNYYFGVVVAGIEHNLVEKSRMEKRKRSNY